MKDSLKVYVKIIAVVKCSISYKIICFVVCPVFMLTTKGTQ